MTSPGASPAASAGEPGRMRVTTAPGRLDAERFGERLIDRLDLDPERAAPHAAMFEQLAHHRAREIGGNGETDADIPAGGV